MNLTVQEFNSIILQLTVIKVIILRVGKFGTALIVVTVVTTTGKVVSKLSGIGPVDNRPSIN